MTTDTTTYVRLQNLLAYVDDNDSAEYKQLWVNNVLEQVGPTAFKVFENETDGWEIDIEEFTGHELEVADNAKVYEFFGSVEGRVSFFKKDITVYKNIDNNNYYVMQTDYEQVFNDEFMDEIDENM
jgi:hypothetical protein